MFAIVLEQPIELQNGLLYPREEVEQRSHSGTILGRQRMIPASGKHEIM